MEEQGTAERPEKQLRILPGRWRLARRGSPLSNMLYLSCRLFGEAISDEIVQSVRVEKPGERWHLFSVGSKVD